MKLFFSLIFVLLLSSCANLSKQSEGYDEYLTGFEYPYEVKSYQLYDGHKMVYMDIAPAQEAQGVVVLLHGKNFNGAYWQKTADDLVARGHRVIIPDQLGFGKSDKPTEYQYSFHALADNTMRLLNDLEIKEATIVGHSMGGMLAVRMALMFPKQVKKLVLVNPIGLEDWKRVAPYTPMDIRLASQNKETREDIIAYQQKFYYDGQWSDEFEQAALHLIGWRLGPDREKMAEIAALTTEMVFTQPVVYEFNLIQAPTLLIIGERDRTAIGRGAVSAEIAETMGRYDRLGELTCRAIKNCQLHKLKGIGHLPQIESYDAYIKALVKFL